MRGDESFAYDLIVRYGPVSSRVALLLRSAEGKPFFASISQGPRRLGAPPPRGSPVPRAPPPLNSRVGGARIARTRPPRRGRGRAATHRAGQSSAELAGARPLHGDPHKSLCDDCGEGQIELEGGRFCAGGGAGRGGRPWVVVARACPPGAACLPSSCRRRKRAPPTLELQAQKARPAYPRVAGARHAPRLPSSCRRRNAPRLPSSCRRTRHAPRLPSSCRRRRRAPPTLELQAHEGAPAYPRVAGARQAPRLPSSCRRRKRAPPTLELQAQKARPAYPRVAGAESAPRLPSSCRRTTRAPPTLELQAQKARPAYPRVAGRRKRAPPTLELQAQKARPAYPRVAGARHAPRLPSSCRRRHAPRLPSSCRRTTGAPPTLELQAQRERAPPTPRVAGARQRAPPTLELQAQTRAPPTFELQAQKARPAYPRVAGAQSAACLPSELPPARPRRAGQPCTQGLELWLGAACRARCVDGRGELRRVGGARPLRLEGRRGGLCGEAKNSRVGGRRRLPGEALEGRRGAPSAPRG